MYLQTFGLSLDQSLSTMILFFNLNGHKNWFVWTERVRATGHRTEAGNNGAAWDRFETPQRRKDEKKAQF